MSLFRIGQKNQPQRPPPDKETPVSEPVRPAEDAREGPSTPAREVPPGPTSAPPPRPLPFSLSGLVHSLFPGPRDSAYRSSDEHLGDELARIEVFVRAQTLRWHTTFSSSAPEDTWGGMLVTRAEVDTYLNWNVRPERDLPEAIESELRPAWDAAQELQMAIDLRCSKSDSHALRLLRLKQLFHLERPELDVLLVLLLPEINARYRRIYGYLQGDGTRTRTTIELVLQILALHVDKRDLGRFTFEPRSSLVRHQLIMVGGDADSEHPLPSRFVRLDQRIVGYLLGDSTPDSRLDGLLKLVPPLHQSDVVASKSNTERLPSVCTWWASQRQRLRVERAEEGTIPHYGGVIFLHGPYGSGRKRAARAITGENEPATPLWIADTAAALRSPLGFERIVMLAFREALLQDGALYWEYVESLFPTENDTAREAQFQALWDTLVTASEYFAGLTFLASQTAWEPDSHFRSRTFLRLDFQVLNYELRQRLWEKYLPALDPKSEEQTKKRAKLIGQLARVYQFTEGQIEDALAAAWHIASANNPGNPHLSDENIYEGCRRQSARRLNPFAQRIEPRQGLKRADLVLPLPNGRQFDDLLMRMSIKVKADPDRKSGLLPSKGLVALFTGASGTGKTLAAQILASERQVDLYKVDLSAIVSKYVGDTEKNLNGVFAEAEGSNSILFFDECEALFAKRAEVKEARDRWANSEANYLLQRIEDYSGIVILATNLRQNIDEAFLRRIHMIVEFPLPDEGSRVDIWTRMFSGRDDSPAPQEILDLAKQFSLSGGSIRNIVEDATARAAAESQDWPQTGVKVRHLVLSTAREYQKLGRPLTKGEFGAAFFSLVEREILAGLPPVKPGLAASTEEIDYP